MRMVAIGVVSAVAATVVAIFIPWLPTSASKEMDRITFVYWFATIICIGIFALVASVLIYSVWAFRASKYDESDGLHIHGHTGLEVVWTVVPFILVVALGIVSAVVMTKNDNAGNNPLRLKVFAQQFAWRFEYPEQDGIKSYELVLPVDRGVKVELESADVIHSFWVPELGQKQDLVPGAPQRVVITPTRTGSFRLICTELCGLGHATMRAPVRVVTQTEFDAWVEEQKAGSGGAADGASVFASAGCGGCHVFAPAGSSGQVGPGLDDLQAAADKAGQPLEEFVHDSIVEPDKAIADGYSAGVMPGTFGESLEAEEIDALVKYLTETAG
jgi:cytochrome c oxidase subunit 2